jgi:hypothetical protein
VLENVVDFPQERPGPADVSQDEMDADQFDPGLDGPVGVRVGQLRPSAQGISEFLARR